MTRSGFRAAMVAVALLGAVAATPLRAATLFVHVPDLPVDPTRLASAANDLADDLAAATGVPFEARIFRRHEDAAAYLARDGRTAAVLLTDAPFLLDLPPGLEVDTTHRLADRGRETYRKLAVVRSTSTLRALHDLREATVSLAQSAGASGTLYLEHAVLAGRIALGPGGLVRLEPVVDDLTAAANVLYGSTAAALVADRNPLVASALGRDLRAIHTSPPLSLPVLAVRRGALGPTQRRALDTALATLAERPRGAAALAALGVDAIRPLNQRLITREDLLRLRDAPRTLEIALPPAAALALAPAAPPPPRQVVQIGGAPMPEPALVETFAAPPAGVPAADRVPP